ncbi:flagellar assembly peptidoglycan hydrolase FlgJ [Aquincola tertiaricarbonis]|uniref:Peptidoglycan hydrolase FlgJ n=1 Tax=Aquincola tertiaricarbonis TaxID=391953 RepID=A0ABY4S0P7_AQUTE|nr:flagellar assembly peptidoglycan hydrolase FlgJ [Aquincola tertiaricarbonis]URI06024.1 flagellar assembly peptidoglycan hydrolase FlgJ [Aquincola tertiaricarbonis]
MIPTSSAGLSTDPASLATLRNQAATDPKSATREAAKQFESLFMQELLKNMRNSTMQSGMLENSGTQMGTEMLDAQYAKQLSGLRGGLADVIAKQIERQMGVQSTDATSSAGLGPTRAAAMAAYGSVSAVGTDTATPKVQRTPLRPPASAQEFVDRVTADAKAAEASTGIPAAFMISQAALETGWGKKEIKMADGSNSFNLFGIKAGSNWKGPTTEITTTEFINGKATKVKASFRAYSSYEEAFSDYAKLMKESPRYQNVVASGSSAHGFANSLQKAGYATDPQYAEKLGRVINTTLRLQRVNT